MKFLYTVVRNLSLTLLLVSVLLNDTQMTRVQHVNLRSIVLSVDIKPCRCDNRVRAAACFNQRDWLSLTDSSCRLQQIAVIGWSRRCSASVPLPGCYLLNYCCFSKGFRPDVHNVHESFANHFIWF